MATTQLDSSSFAGADEPGRGSSRGLLVSRLAVGFLGLVGAGICVYGVTLPWLSTYEGLLSQKGWGTRNGTILFVGAVLAAVVAVAYAARPSVVFRWLLALVGFGLAAFSGYLLIQLYATFQQLDGMTFAAKGPGLYVAAGGAVAIFATIFLPAPVTNRTHSRLSPSHSTGSTIVATPESLVRLGIRPLRSSLRYPAAGLACVAGLAHVPMTPAHLSEAPYIGGLFMVFTTASILLAAMLLIADSTLIWRALGTVCLLAVLAYALSRTVALPLLSDDVGNWGEPIGFVSILTEGSVVILAVLAVWGSRRQGVATSPAAG